MMAFRIVRSAGRALVPRIRNFSRLPRPQWCLTPLQLRPFAESVKPEDGKKNAEWWPMRKWVKPAMKKLGQSAKKAGVAAGTSLWTWIKYGYWYLVNTKWIQGLGLFSIIGWAAKFSIQYYGKIKEKERDKEDARTGKTVEIAKKEYDMDQFRQTATTLFLVNDVMQHFWRGLEVGGTLQVGDQHSIIFLDGKAVESSVTLTPIDTSPFIQRVLKWREKCFIIVDGTKGCGKSTAMLLLCSHVIQNKGSAIYLKFSAPSKSLPKTHEQMAGYICEDPEKLLTLAMELSRQSKPVTFVLDDFNKYLRGVEHKRTAELILNYLWDATSMYGARVIFTTSDYTLQREIRKFPMHESDAIVEMRIEPPSVTDLTKFIKQGIAQRKEESKEGNSDEDIAVYCEVVSNIRGILDYYFLGGYSSVRATTIEIFNDTVGSVVRHLNTVCGVPKYTSKMQEYWNRHCLTETPIVSQECRNIDTAAYRIGVRASIVNNILNQLLTHQYAQDLLGAAYERAVKMERFNIVRHATNSNRVIEFHSRLEEVAIRALMEKPSPDGKGIGTEKILAYLQANASDFTALRKSVQELLKRSAK